MEAFTAGSIGRAVWSACAAGPAHAQSGKTSSKKQTAGAGMSNAITQVRPCQSPFAFAHPMQSLVSSTSSTCRKERRFMAGFPIEPSGRIKTLPPYLFAAIDEMKQKAIARGVDIINLGIGDPDLPTPAPIVEQLRQAVGNPKYHQYPSYEGMLSFRQAVADWYQRAFGVTLNPADEVLTPVGSKEGVGRLPLGFREHGRVVLV